MRHVIAATLFALLLSGSVASAGLKLDTITKSPTAGGTKFSKILVVLLDKDTDLRRRTEGGLVRRIPNSVAATTLMPNVDLHDRDAVMNVIKSNGVDGVIVLRNVMMGRDYAITPGAVTWQLYPDMWDYWGGTWAVIEQPGYAIPTTTVSADLAIFSIKDEKVVWAARMTSTDPRSLHDLLDNLVKAGRNELKKQKIT